MLDKETEVPLHWFRSGKTVAEALFVAQSSISQTINGRIPEAYGFGWRFATHDEVGPLKDGIHIEELKKLIFFRPAHKYNKDVAFARSQTFEGADPHFDYRSRIRELVVIRDNKLSRGVQQGFQQLKADKEAARQRAKEELEAKAQKDAVLAAEREKRDADIAAAAAAAAAAEEEEEKAAAAAAAAASTAMEEVAKQEKQAHAPVVSEPRMAGLYDGIAALVLGPDTHAPVTGSDIGLANTQMTELHRRSRDAWLEVLSPSSSLSSAYMSLPLIAR
jgi:hypothetical protein